jgi:multidrug efflux pump
MVIVGGMTLGTVLTLFVVPTFYTLLTKGKTFGGTKAAAAQLESEGGGEPAEAPAPAAAPTQAATPAERPSPAAGS